MRFLQGTFLLIPVVALSDVSISATLESRVLQGALFQQIHTLSGAVCLGLCLMRHRLQ